MTVFFIALPESNHGRSRRPLAWASRAALPLLAALLLLSACVPGIATSAAPTAPLPNSPPPLPFADNPDPTLCGIPTPDGRSGIAHGEIDGRPADPILYLYESHLRERITGQIFPDTAVEIVLSQSNPTLDYFFVRTVNVEPPQEGWIPAPFVAVKS